MTTGWTWYVIILVLIIIMDNVRVWLTLLKTDHPTGMNDEREATYCPPVPPSARTDARP